MAKEIRLVPALKTYRRQDESLVSVAFWENWQLVEFLCKMGVSPDLVDTCGGTVLIDASANGHVELLKVLLKYGANPNHLNDSGESVFSFACAWNQFESAKILHSVGVDINHQIGKFGGRPLDWALRDGSKEFITWLREIGCVVSDASN